MEAVSEVGLWVGRDLQSNGHWVVKLDGYKPSTGQYTLKRPLSCQSVRVFDDQFPLRCIHTHSTDLERFEGFVDRFDPMHQHAEGESVDPEDVEYRVKQIIGTRHRGRAKRYIVMWDDGLESVTIEPVAELHPELVAEYEGKLAEAECACAAVAENNLIVTKIQ